MNILERIKIHDVQELVFNTPEQEIKERFKVTDLSGADWCLRKLRAVEINKTEVEELAKKEIERILKWKEKELNQLEAGKAFFEGLLTEYLMTQTVTDPEFRISTPNGKVSLRKQQPKWEYEDSKIIEFLKQTGQAEFIRIKEEVDKEGLKKVVKVVNGQAIDENGMIVEGISIMKQSEKVVIKVVE